MTLQEEKDKLKQLYVNQRKWTQLTTNFGCWTYPHEYYDKLMSLVLKYSK